jgi:hypothetical protein
MLLMLSSSAWTPLHASVASHKADNADFNMVPSVDRGSLFGLVQKGRNAKETSRVRRGFEGRSQVRKDRKKKRK